VTQPLLDLATIDRDGAIREAAERTCTRGALLGGALAAIGALALPAAAAAQLAPRHGRGVIRNPVTWRAGNALLPGLRAILRSTPEAGAS
jgi:hypothetical protein